MDEVEGNPEDIFFILLTGENLAIFEKAVQALLPRIGK
jgi:hypothetical protein